MIGKDGVTPPANQVIFLGDVVVFFNESTAAGYGRILSPEVMEQLKQGLRPYEAGP